MIPREKNMHVFSYHSRNPRYKDIFIRSKEIKDIFQRSIKIRKFWKIIQIHGKCNGCLRSFIRKLCKLCI